MPSSATAPHGPLTYVISYSPGNTVSDEWLERVRQNPPHILHHGHDVPLNNLWGPTAGYSPWDPDPTGSVDDVRAKMGELRRGIDRLRDAGARWIIPYMNPSIIGGNPPVRTGDTASALEEAGGLFHFWLRRDEFSGLGLDTSASDPLDWLQRCRMSFAPYKADSPFGRWEPCLRREPWLKFLETVCSLIAEAGYDGCFSDDNLVACYCPTCCRDFRRFLQSEYPDRIRELTDRAPLEAIVPYSDDGRGLGPAQRRATVGHVSHGPEYGADSWNTLVWEASQAFWGETVGEMLERNAAAGRRHNADFFIVANWGMSSVVGEFGIRRRLGHDFSRWRRDVDGVARGAIWQMLEEDGSRGYVSPGLVAEFWTACRVVAEHGAEPALLTYQRSDPRQAELGYAEVASANCGAFLEGSPTELGSRWRAFLDEHRDLFENAQPYAPIRLYYSLAELRQNNDDHLRLFYAAARALGRSHLPFGVIISEQIERGLETGCVAFINPAAGDMPGNAEAPILTLGPDGERPERLLAREEIDIDGLLGLSGDEREKSCAVWADRDLSAAAPIADVLKSLVGRDLALTDSRDANAVRLRPYTTADRQHLVVHVVNYGWVPIGEGIVAPGTAPSFRLNIPDACAARDHCPRSVEGVWTIAPDSDRELLTVTDSDGCATVDLPPTDVYRAVVIRYR